MNKADEYTKYATQCVQLASRATSSVNKARLLKMAEDWLELANWVAQGAFGRKSAPV
jgi:hypothetical protein